MATQFLAYLSGIETAYTCNKNNIYTSKFLAYLSGIETSTLVAFAENEIRF